MARGEHTVPEMKRLSEEDDRSGDNKTPSQRVTYSLLHERRYKDVRRHQAPGVKLMFSSRVRSDHTVCYAKHASGLHYCF